jgi:squalene/phytoene synthase
VYPTRQIERLVLVFAGRGRPALAALAELDRELACAHAAAVDHGVAHAKLAWWHDEFERTASGHAVHPLTRRLYALGGAVDWRLLGERVTAAERALAGFVPANPAEYERECFRSHGVVWVVASQLLAPAVPGLVDFGAALGTGIGLAACRAAAAAPTLAAELARRAAAQLARADAALAPALRPALVGALVARALAGAHLARPPNPIVQLSIAWRAARGALEERAS